MSGKQRKAMADQIDTASKARQRRIGQVSRHDLGAVERAILIQLGLG